MTVPARNLGGELELLYQLTPHDRVGLNYNYVESHWQDKSAEFALAQPEEKRALTPNTITANYEHVSWLSRHGSASLRDRRIVQRNLFDECIEGELCVSVLGADTAH